MLDASRADIFFMSSVLIEDEKCLSSVISWSTSASDFSGVTTIYPADYAWPIC